MENREPQAQQVWQRVFARNEEQPRSDLRELLLEAAELAGIYRRLTGLLTGKPRDLAKSLYEGEQETLAVLKGLSRLMGQGDEVLKLWNPEKEPGRKLLEKAYHKTRRCMVDYMARSAEPEFGVVFRILAERAGNSCAGIAQLLGML